MIFKLYCVRSGLLLASSEACLHMLLNVKTSLLFLIFW